MTPIFSEKDISQIIIDASRTGSVSRKAKSMLTKLGYIKKDNTWVNKGKAEASVGIAETSVGGGRRKSRRRKKRYKPKNKSMKKIGGGKKRKSKRKQSRKKQKKQTKV